MSQRSFIVPSETDSLFSNELSSKSSKSKFKSIENSKKSCVKLEEKIIFFKNDQSSLNNDDSCNVDIISESENESDYLDNLIEIGPPAILKYNAKKETSINKPVLIEYLNEEQIVLKTKKFFNKELREYLDGGIICEFCQSLTLKWPTSSSNDSKGFCCNDYKEYLQGIIDFNQYREELKKNVTIDNYRSKAYIQKMKNNKKLLEKKIAEIKKLERILSKPSFKSDLFNNYTIQKPKYRQSINNNNKPVGIPQKDLESFISEKAQENSSSKDSSNGLPSIASFIQNNAEVRVRSRISYFLSNKIYIDQGWTLLNKNYESESQKGDLIPLDEERNISALDILAPMQYNKLIMKSYKETGNLFELILADNTGNVYYPNGKLAIILTGDGDHRTFIAFNHTDKITTILAFFDSKGNGYCNYINGKLRYQLNIYGAINFDEKGNCIKRWLWPSNTQSLTFRPVMFRLNEYMSIKIHNRAKINFYFRYKQNSCKFAIGSKISQNLKINKLNSNHFKSNLTDETCIKLKTKADLLLKILDAGFPNKNQEEMIKSMISIPTVLSEKNKKPMSSINLPEIRAKNESRDMVSRVSFNHSSIISTERESLLLNQAKKKNSINFSLQNIQTPTNY